MRKQIRRWLAAAVGVAALGLVHFSAQSDDRFIVHEWGTFTSVAGDDGVALDWRPLTGPSDLPGFVYGVGQPAICPTFRHDPGVKRSLKALVRMETPVLYFYAGREIEASVKVDFPRGQITEWYPRADAGGAAAEWRRFRVRPGADVSVPTEKAASHYYAARETDAAPVVVGDGAGAEHEKFLFYRGVGSFDLPLFVQLRGDKVVMRNFAATEIPAVVLFENRGGKVGYQVHGRLEREAAPTEMFRPLLDQTVDSLARDLERMLAAQGLYPKEAAAMVKTWHDSWFEEGLRVFYIVPRRTTDAVLPIRIDPQPMEITRVFVGRMELITPEMEKSIEKDIDSGKDASRLGRFAEAGLHRLLAKTTGATLRRRIQELLAKAG